MSDASKSNLRPGGPRFVGRTAELARLDGLHAEGHRLVTVVGPPGTGKTRLAEAFARRMAPELCGPGGGGVWVVELAQARDVEGVCAALGRTLGVSASAPATDEVVRRLGDAIAARGPILLVLDNFEQLVDAAASSVGAWLAAAPDARFLVTSRAPLRLRDEVRFDLPALTLPGPGVDVASSEAVQLFVDRVRSFDTAFALASTNEGVVAELVRKLEGIPLAIELAACRVELFGVGGLLEQLDKRLDVLEQDTRDVDDRHATLRAAIDWSWGLLDDDERRVLAACSVFRGGFTADAARSVLAGMTVRSVLSVLQALRDESLLRRIDVDGHSRFALFESVREFAEERLVHHGDVDDVRRRHAEHYLASGERWAGQIGTRGGPDALRQLALERDNLLAVHAFAVEGIGRSEEAIDRTIRAALVLDALAAVRGPFGSHLDLLDRTIAAVDAPSLDPVMRARLLQARARTRAMHGQGAAAQRDFDAALTVAPVTAAELQAELGVDVAVHAHQQRRDLDAALVLYEQAVALARSAGARAVEGRALGNLGALHHDLRHFSEALALYREALAVIQEVGDRRLEAIHVANVGILEQETGELARARAHFQTADELLAELGDRRLQAIVIGNLGTLEHEEGHPEKARACHERALAILREVGDRRSEALCLGRLARANAALEWIDDAMACLSAADRLLGRYDDPLARAAVEMNRGFVDVASARVARRIGDADACATSVAEARARISKASHRGDAALSWVEQSDDIRAAVRILDREIERLDGMPRPAIVERAALVLGPEAKWFQVPGADAQDLRKRKALRAILWGLAQRHREEPGGGLALEDLLELGWPGERVLPSAGANRVYVALTTLRNMGLRGHLISQGDGYLLDPALPVERVVHDAPS